MGRHDDGLAALERAVKAAEGPRRCDYLQEQADWLAQLARHDAELAVIERLIEGRGKLPGAGQKQKLGQAKQRRDRLKAELGR
jgi:hypothetical protein